MNKAVILFSGGLDSTTCLAIAKSQNYIPYALSFSYGQRHQVELKAAKNLATIFEVQEHRVVNIDIGQFGGSALTDSSIAIPNFSKSNGIPITYVPARNTVFLAIALSYAESIGAEAIFLGANAVDYSNYPDCREDYLNTFETMAQYATKAGREGKSIKIHAPLLHLSKKEIIQWGYELGIDYSLTLSCYQPTPAGEACGRCDSCQFRKQGFLQAGIEDPTRYARD